MPTTFKPSGPRVLVLPTPIADKTAEGIIIPADSQRRPNTGTVVDWGALTIPTPTTGSTVLFSEYGHTEITLNSVPHLLIDEAEILGTFTTSP